MKREADIISRISQNQISFRADDRAVYLFEYAGFVFTESVYAVLGEK